MDQTPNELPLEALTDRNVGIKLVGVGGGGSNAVDRLKMENLDRLQLAVINTDFKALSTSPVQDKILIGTKLTRGLSAGGDPELGRKAAESDADKIAEIVKGTDLVFLVAGLGGGPGSGATPVVAEIAADARGGGGKRGGGGGGRHRLCPPAVPLRGRPPPQAGGGSPRRAAPGVRRGH